jgi:hypothetical protein
MDGPTVSAENLNRGELLLVDRQNVEVWFGFHASHHPQAVFPAPLDQVVSEDASISLTVADDMQVQRHFADWDPVVDPSRSPTVSDDVLDHLDRLVCGPVVFKPIPEGYQKLSSASFRGSPSNC